jgi:lactose/L-arabinose transport system permease protein
MRPGLRRAQWRRVPTYVFLSIASILSVFPLYFMLVSSTNTSADVLGDRLYPGGALWTNLMTLIDQQNLGGALYHSAVNAVLTTVFAIAICAVAGYGFEVFHSKGKDVVMRILLLALMIPFAATMIPLFKLFTQMGMINSTFAVILPAISTPFLIMLFRQASRAFPHEILEAARLDGLRELAIFIRIYLPTMKSTFAAAFVIVFMAAWNNFLWPRVILLDNAYQTMPMLLSNLTAGYVTDYGILMLGVTIASLPTVIIFLILQRSFAQGITGGIK